MKKINTEKERKRERKEKKKKEKMKKKGRVHFSVIISVDFVKRFIHALYCVFFNWILSIKNTLTCLTVLLPPPPPPPPRPQVIILLILFTYQITPTENVTSTSSRKLFQARTAAREAQCFLLPLVLPCCTDD